MVGDLDKTPVGPVAKPVESGVEGITECVAFALYLAKTVTQVTG